MIVIILHAPPLSGKTTLCKGIAEHLDVSIINYDQIALEQNLIRVEGSKIAYESSNKEKWSLFFWSIHNECRLLMQRNRVILLDHHHSKTFQRSPILNLAAEFGYQVWLVKLEVPMEHRLQRLTVRTALNSANDIPLSAQQLMGWGNIDDPIEDYHREFVFSDLDVRNAISKIINSLSPYAYPRNA